MKHDIIDTTNMELTEKVVSIKRVTKVVKGGRNMSCFLLIHYASPCSLQGD